MYMKLISTYTVQAKQSKLQHKNCSVVAMFLQPKMANNGKKRSQTQSILSFVSKRPRDESSDSLTQQELTGETSTEVRAANSNPTTSSIPAFRPYDFGALKEPFQENQLTDDKSIK